MRKSGVLRDLIPFTAELSRNRDHGHGFLLSAMLVRQLDYGTVWRLFQ
jgi:hypothetical protein